jgi:hypothetical protein
MKQGIRELISGIELIVNRKFEKTTRLTMLTCLIQKYDSSTHRYTGTIKNIQYSNIMSINPTQFAVGDSVRVLANVTNNILSNITIIGKIQ